MALPPFQTPSENFSSSIVMDASTIGGTTVTVAVHAHREQEPAILDSIYEHGAGIGFKPFYHKANSFEHQVRRDFCEDLIRDQQHRITAFSHDLHLDGNTDTQQIEAVHSAIHVHDLLSRHTRNPLVIVDGNEQQATPLIKALSGLRSEVPVVAHCQQSESYYPTALLADLASSHLAHSIENQCGNPTDVVLSSPRAKQKRSSDWGTAFSATYANGAEYAPPELPSLRGESVRERVNCWYEGAVAQNGGNDRPLTDSLTPVVNALERNGYDDVASMLREL